MSEIVPETKSLEESLAQTERIDISAFADSECRFCHGDGLVRTTKDNEYAICICAAKWMADKKPPRNFRISGMITPPGE